MRSRLNLIAYVALLGSASFAMAEEKPSVVSVRVVQAKRKLSPRIVSTIAPLAGQKQAAVYAKVPGRVTSIGAHEGEPVKAGQVLFRIDRSDPGESYLSAPTLSPISGWIGQWYVETTGEQVTTSDPVVLIVDDSELRISAYVPADEWIEISPQTKVSAIVGNQERPAKVVRIARAADLGSGRGLVTLQVQNPGHDWRAGMFARLRFEIAPKNRILLSSAALIVTDQGAFVYVVDGEHAKRVPVEYDVLDSDSVEILKGVEPEMQVVVAGANLLNEKSQLKIIE